VVKLTKVVGVVYKANMKEETFQPTDFKLECTTVWSFPQRGDWATHNSSFRGNWAPQISRNIILRYSKEKDIVLDQMVGSGTTAIECKLLNRNFIGIDINPEMINITKKAIDFESQSNAKIMINIGDARKLESIKDESIDLIATHPPYVDIIKYSNGKIDGDLSNIHDIDEFCNEMLKIAKECFGKEIPNTPMMGALVKVTKFLDINGVLEDTTKKLQKKFLHKPEIIDGNIKSIKRAYDEISG